MKRKRKRPKPEYARLSHAGYFCDGQIVEVVGRFTGRSKLGRWLGQLVHVRARNPACGRRKVDVGVPKEWLIFVSTEAVPPQSRAETSQS